MRKVKAETDHTAFHSRLFQTILFLAACLTLQTGQAQPAVTVTAFEGARLITGDGSAPIEDGVFLVVGEQITRIGRQGELTVPAGATRVDLRGKTVMPAIIDTHKHLSGERETLITQLRQLAYFGVGTVMSLGQDINDVPFEVHEESIPGTTREYTAGRGITTPEPGRSDAPYWVTSEEEGRAAVKEQAERQVDFIKIWVDDRNGAYEKMSPALYAAIIDEAHANKLPVTAHIFAMEDAKGLLRAGIDAFAHGIRDRDIDDEVVALFKERPRVFLVPNLPDRGVAVDMSWLSGSIAADQLTKLQAGATDRPDVQKTFGIQARNLARLNKAGVKIAFGTDGSTVWAHHVEMADMVAAGMTPAEVIVAATSNSAELMRLSNTGTLASGKNADFIVLDANPLDDITNTRRINSVYIRGTAVNRASMNQ